MVFAFRNSSVFVVALIACVGYAGCGGESPPHHHAPAPAEDRAVVDAKHAELLAIADAIFASDEQYYGQAPLAALIAADTTGMTPESLARHDFSLGGESYKDGDVRTAEEAFLRCFERTGSHLALFMAGLAQLRSGVDTNCIMMAPPEACIFPLVESAYYMDRTGALRAVESFRAVLDSGAQIPGYMMKARFFLNLSHMVVGQYPDSVSSAYLLAPELFASPRDPGRFRNVAPSVGMNTLNHAGGIAMEDFDGDGFLDIFTTSSWLDEPARYFRNNGDGTFSDRSEEAGLAGQVGGLNLVHADYDGDGHEDVLILRGGWLMEWGRQPRSLLRNDGTGVFTDVTREAGLGGADYPSQTAAFADYDLDGDLDLYIGNEADDTGKRHYPSQLFR
ncbi:MAG: VCBS repeat-containing protein, partial [Gemmatimonadota bacterium]|nr:VCBS repeat-containing protein [Gemmatimonadota bacterium]